MPTAWQINTGALVTRRERSAKSLLKPFLSMIVFGCAAYCVGRGLNDWQQAKKANTSTVNMWKSLFAEPGHLNPHTAVHTALFLLDESDG